MKKMGIVLLASVFSSGCFMEGLQGATLANSLIPKRGNKNGGAVIIEPQPTIEEQIKQAEAKRRLCAINNGRWVNGLCLEPLNPFESKLEEDDKIAQTLLCPPSLCEQKPKKKSLVKTQKPIEIQREQREIVLLALLSLSQ